MTAPPASGMSLQATSYRLMRPAAAAALWTQSSTNSDQVVIQPGSDCTVTARLSAAVRAISPGDLVLFDCPAGSASALAVVTGVAEEFWVVPYPSSVSPAPTPPDIVVAHTALTLTLAQLDSYALQDADPATVAVRYGFKDVGTIIGIPAPALNSLPAVDVSVPGSYTPSSPPATAFLTDATGAGVLVTVTGAGTGQVTLAGAGSPPATIGTRLLVPLQLLLDVVPVSRGTTVTGEVLGSGNAALANQSFTLAKSPLTYLASGSGSAAALAVYVDGVQWQQVPSFFGQSPSARVFVVSRSADQTITTITFGDGVTAARLTSGTGNVTVTYRYGSGAASPPAGRLTTIMQPQPNLASIQNPIAVSGGADPQAPADIRSDAPASVFSFGRAVSAVDYEVIASQAPGVSRVAANWTFDGTTQRTLVTVYVGDGPAAVAAAAAALTGSEDPNRPVSVIGATPIDLWLTCTLVVAADRQIPAVVAAATAAISDSPGGMFSPSVMGIGQRLYRSAIAAALMVPGVVAVHDLTVTWLVTPPATRFAPEFRLLRSLEEFFDPGESSFFDLPPANVTMVGVRAGG
jgi:Baseplate J-like protein